MLQVIIGGLLAILGGFVATYYQAKKARKIRMDEIIAEKKIQASAEAFTKFTELKGVTMLGTTKAAVQAMEGQKEWLFNNRLFLPGQFYSKWFSLRKVLHNIQSVEEDLEAPKNAQDKQEPITKKMDLKNSVERLLSEAEKEILKDMNVSPLSIE